jgi:hypothetical protein
LHLESRGTAMSKRTLLPAAVHYATQPSRRMREEKTDHGPV